MVLGLMPGMSLTAQAAVPKGLYLGTTQVNTGSNSSGAGWSYNKNSKTLTLDGFNFSATSADQLTNDAAISVYLDGELNIVLNGENSISKAQNK